jgi:hypothetical protein
MARGKTICEWHKKHPGGLLVAACRGGVRFMAVFVIKTADFVIMGGLFVISGRVKRERLALAGHALGAGLEHIRLDALPGGFGGGADGIADGFLWAKADIVAFGVVGVVVAALAFTDGHGHSSFS